VLSERSVLFDRAAALRDDGQLEAAVAVAKDLLALVPDDAGAWEILGTILCALCRYEDAVSAYSSAIGRAASLPDERPSMDMGIASPWYNRAALYACLGRQDMALADLRQAVDRAPGWAEIVLSDKRFQSLSADPALQWIVEQGCTTARKARTLALARGLGEVRDSAAELFDVSKEFASPSLTEHVRAIVFDAMNEVTAQSAGEDVERQVEYAFARLAEVLADQGVASPEAKLTQRTAHGLINLALLFHLHDLVDRLGEGPWWD
jgi:tetratricopeptide (TPR) repeat protein